MKMLYSATRILIVLVLAFESWSVPATAQKHPNVVVVRPREIEAVLTNPGMGITTFQRFNGQALNPVLTWSERGPEAKLPQAPTQPLVTAPADDS